VHSGARAQKSDGQQIFDNRIDTVAIISYPSCYFSNYSQHKGGNSPHPERRVEACMENTLTKAGLVEAVSNAMAISRKDAVNIVDTVLETIRIQLENGESVQITRFGNFNIRSKQLRQGRNPKTGEPCEITARKILNFKPSQILKKRVLDGQRNATTG
jgi:integration host factor subunit alpha